MIGNAIGQGSSWSHAVSGMYTDCRGHAASISVGGTSCQRVCVARAEPARERCVSSERRRSAHVCMGSALLRYFIFSCSTGRLYEGLLRSAEWLNRSGRLRKGSNRVMLHPISPGCLNFIPFRVERGRPIELSGTDRGKLEHSWTRTSTYCYSIYFKTSSQYLC